MMRFQFHAGIEESHRQTIPFTRPMLAGQLVREIASVIGCHHVWPAVSPIFRPWDVVCRVQQSYELRGLLATGKRLPGVTLR